MRSRCSLHLTKVDEFASFCESHGFTRQMPLTDAYEVLRMTKKGEHPVICHARGGAKEHATIWGTSERMFRKWRRSEVPAANSTEDMTCSPR